MPASLRPWLLLLGMFLGVAVIVAAFYFEVSRWKAKAHDRINEIEQRFSRLEGLVKAAPTLQDGIKQAQDGLKRFLIPVSSEPVRAGNDLLQKVRGVAESAGMSVVSSQVLTVTEYHGFDKINIEFSANTSLQNLQTVLAALAKQEPALVVDELQITPVRRVFDYEPEMVFCRLAIYSLRSKT